MRMRTRRGMTVGGGGGGRSSCEGPVGSLPPAQLYIFSMGTWGFKAESTL